MDIFIGDMKPLRDIENLMSMPYFLLFFPFLFLLLKIKNTFKNNSDNIPTIHFVYVPYFNSYSYRSCLSDQASFNPNFLSFSFLLPNNHKKIRLS